MFAALQSIVFVALAAGSMASPTPARTRITNYGGIGGNFNGANSTIQVGDNFGNSFNNTGVINGGFIQGSGNSNVTNNGAFGGNRFNFTSGGTKRATNLTNYGGVGGSFNGAGSAVQLGDNFSNSFRNVSTVNGGFIQGSGNHVVTNNGAFGGNRFNFTNGGTKRATKLTNYGGIGGSFNGAGSNVQLGDNFSNNFNNTGTINGGFVQGSGNHTVTNNGAFGGNRFNMSSGGTKRATKLTNYGGIGGNFNGAGSAVQIGDSFGNEFRNVSSFNGGLVQGSGNFTVKNNGAFGGNVFSNN